jgi:hypothetical protein
MSPPASTDSGLLEMLTLERIEDNITHSRAPS